jgi:hypothetical protein
LQIELVFARERHSAASQDADYLQSQIDQGNGDLGYSRQVWTQKVKKVWRDICVASPSLCIRSATKCFELVFDRHVRQIVQVNKHDANSLSLWQPLLELHTPLRMPDPRLIRGVMELCSHVGGAL